MPRELPPTHPGEHLAEFLHEYGLTPYALAKAIHVPRSRVEALVRCQRGITADTEALAMESTPIQPIAA